MSENDDAERLLRERLGELVSRAAELDAALAELRGWRDASTDDEHDPDGAPVSGEWSRLTGSRRETQAELEATDAALGRIAAGAYGSCARCARPIGPARLRARPTATLCIECAERASRRP